MLREKNHLVYNSTFSTVGLKTHTYYVDISVVAGQSRQQLKGLKREGLLEQPPPLIYLGEDQF